MSGQLQLPERPPHLERTSRDGASALAAFRQEMGFDSNPNSPAVLRHHHHADETAVASSQAAPPPTMAGLVPEAKLAAFTLKGSVAVTNDAPAPTPVPSTALGDRSPGRGGSRLFRFGRASTAVDDPTAAVVEDTAVRSPVGDKPKPPRTSLQLLFSGRGGPDEVSPRGSSGRVENEDGTGASPPHAEKMRSPRSSLSGLIFRRQSVAEEVDSSASSSSASSTTSGSPPPSRSGLSAKMSLPTLSSDSLPVVKVSRTPQSQGKGSPAVALGGAAAAAASSKPDLRTLRTVDRRRSRSLTNIMASEDDKSDLSMPGLFGMPLEELMTRQPQSPRETGEALTEVPYVMDLLLRRFEAAGGFASEGIFRLSIGSVVKHNAMVRLHQFDYTMRPKDYDDPHLYCVLLKEWVKRLPMPLIEDYAACLRLGASSSEDCSEQIGALWGSMTPLARAVLRRLMLFVQTATAHEKVTRMNVTNLCIVFAPGILRPKAEQSALEMLRDQGATQAALLKVYEWVVKQAETK